MKLTNNGVILYGDEAIAYAMKHDLYVNKYADPTEEARDYVQHDEAMEIAAVDPGLIWIEAH